MKTSKKAKTATTKDKASSGVSKVRQSILDTYIAQLQKTGKAHISVHSLCLDLKIGEKEFYGEFSSLSAVEKHFWKGWIESIIDAVSSGKEWGAFSAKEQYLAFLFAFAGEALEHRSLLEQRFANLTLLCSPDTLDGLKSSFKDFASAIIARGMESGEIAHRGPLGNVYPEVLYIHWRSVLEYFLKDERETSYLLQQDGILFQLVCFGLLFGTHIICTEFIYRLRGQAQVAHDRDTRSEYTLY